MLSRVRPLPVLVVGCGRRGRRWLDELDSHPRFSVAGVVDPDPAARASAPRRVRAWPGIAEALVHASPQAAVVVSPPALHAEHALACAEAGLAVLVEKPAATCAPDAVRLVAVSRETGTPILVAQNFRFLPRERAVRAALRNAGLGPPVRSTVVSSRARQEHDADGDVLWGFVLHHLDALRTRFGAEPATVEARRTTEGTAERWEVFLAFGGATVTYRHEEGAAGYAYAERIECADGTLTVDDQRVRVSVNGRRTRRVRARGPAPERTILDELGRAMDGHRSELGIDDNVRTIALVAAAERSARERAAVSVEGRP